MSEKKRIMGRVFVGIPQDPPVQLMSQLVRYLEQQDKVYIAYMLQMYKEAEMSYLLILGFKDRVEDENTIQEISKISKPFLDKYNMDICLLSTRFGITAVNGKEPFFHI